jgi:hypothetical protein
MAASFLKGKGYSKYSETPVEVSLRSSAKLKKILNYEIEGGHYFLESLKSNIKSRKTLNRNLLHFRLIVIS